MQGLKRDKFLLKIVDIKIKFFLIFLYIIIFLISSFFPKTIYLVLESVIFIIIFITDIQKVKVYNKYSSILLLILGSILLFYNKIQFNGWLEAFNFNSDIICLLLSIPLLSTLLQYKDFNINRIYVNPKLFKDQLKFYTFTNIISYFFSMIINLASIPLLHDVFKKNIDKDNKKIFYKSVTRGFSSNILWSPYFASVAIVLKYVGLQWYKIAPIGLLLSLLANLTGILLMRIASVFKSEQTVHNYDIDDQYKEGNTNNKSTFLIALIMLFLLITIVILENITDKSILILLPIICFLFPVFLSIISFNKELSKFVYTGYYQKITYKKNDELILFTSIGFFGYALNNSSLINYLIEILNKFNFTSSAPLILSLILIIGLFSIIGIHPIISISTITMLYSKSHFDISELQLAMSFLSGYFLYSILSPFSSCTLVLGSTTNEFPLDISVRINFIYSLIYAILATTVIMVL